MTEKSRDVAGVVLAGGLSTRLGEDKWALHLYGQEQPDLLGRTHCLLHAMLPQCWVSCRRSAPFPGYDCLYDEAEGLGPVSGIMAGVMAAQHSGFSAVLVLSCDLPFISRPVLEKLLAARRERHSQALVTTFCHEDSGLVQPLVAIYEVESLLYFELAMTTGLRQIRRLIPPDRQQRIYYGTAEERAFFNINTAEDLAEARRLIAADTAQ